MNKIFLIVTLFLINASAYAKSCFDCSPFYWGISGSFGMAQYNDAYAQDGRSFIGRLGLEVQYALNDLALIGLESGIQNGNSMRLNVPKTVLDVLGGEPVHVTIKPTIDLLGTLKITPFNSGIFAYFKGGAAYRHLQVDINEVNDVTQITPELQAGIGFGFNDNNYLYVGYQGLFGKNTNYTVNPDTGKGYIENIPSQNSVLIGVSVMF